MNLKNTLLVGLYIILAISCKENTNINSDPLTQYKDRIWIHRVNTIKKANYFKDKYVGLEIDVQYSDSLQTMIIKHNFDNSGDEIMNPNITFDEWLSEVKNINNKGIWLDFKNLSGENAQKSAMCIDSLLEKHQLTNKSNIIVESGNPQLLNIFSERGLRTSYYMPYFDNKTSPERIEEICEKVSKDIKEYKISTISSYDFQYDVFKQKFPNCRKLLWTTNPDKLVWEKSISEKLKDTMIDVFLIPDEMPTDMQQ